MRKLFGPVLAGVLACAVLTVAAGARAASIDALATSPGGDTAVRITLTQEAGDILFTLSVEKGTASLRDVFLNIAGDKLSTGLHVDGELVTDFDVHLASKVHNDDHRGDDEGESEEGSHQGEHQGEHDEHGRGPLSPFDISIALGTPCRHEDDILSTSFVLSNQTRDLTLADFSNQLFGVRVTGGERDGDGDDEGEDGGGTSATTLTGSFAQVPEPATGLLMTLGIGALSWWADRRRR